MTGRPSLFPTPLPALPLVGLTAFLPHVEEQYGLTTFRKVDPKGVGVLSPPGALCVHDRVLSRPCTRSSAFWLKPVSILGLVLITTFIKSSHVFTIPSIQPLLRLMLAETPSPRGSGASESLWVPCPQALYGRYLPAHLRRILLMEQQVWSRRARQSALRPRVAAIDLKKKIF